jgi:hypothetical protein
MRIETLKHRFVYSLGPAAVICSLYERQ